MMLRNFYNRKLDHGQNQLNDVSLLHMFKSMYGGDTQSNQSSSSANYNNLNGENNAHKNSIKNIQSIPQFQAFTRQSKLSSSKRSLQSLYPISRESVAPKKCQSLRSSMRKRPQSDIFNGYGSQNPPNESVLANALLNNESSRATASSRASIIEQNNFEEAQMELVKTLLAAQSVPSKPTRFIRRPQSASSNNERPKSFSATSEVDFTNMLTKLMYESSSSQRSDEELSSDRWEAYLRSRVRTSKRISDESRPSYAQSDQAMSGGTHSTNSENSHENSQTRLTHSENSQENQKFYDANNLCSQCGAATQDTHSLENQGKLFDYMLQFEERMKQHMDLKIAELRNDMAFRYENIHEIMTQQYIATNQLDDGFSDVLKSSV